MEDKMDILNKAKTGKKERPIKVVQFGEGNFLRGFVDYMIDIANEQGKFDGDIVLIKAHRCSVTWICSTSRTASILYPFAAM